LTKTLAKLHRHCMYATGQEFMWSQEPRWVARDRNCQILFHSDQVFAAWQLVS